MYTSILRFIHNVCIYAVAKISLFLRELGKKRTTRKESVKKNVILVHVDRLNISFLCKPQKIKIKKESRNVSFTTLGLQSELLKRISTNLSSFHACKTENNELFEQKLMKYNKYTGAVGSKKNKLSLILMQLGTKLVTFW